MHIEYLQYIYVYILVVRERDIKDDFKVLAITKWKYEFAIYLFVENLVREDLEFIFQKVNL